MPDLDLFANISPDLLGFGQGSTFHPEKVKEFLQLKKQDVSHLAGVSIKSVRYDQNIPQAVFDRFEQIATTCNTVATVFDGDADKTALWFRTKNPLLGDMSPRDMIRLGRYDRLRRFIAGAMANRAPVDKATPA